MVSDFSDIDYDIFLMMHMVVPQAKMRRCNGIVFGATPTVYNETLNFHTLHNRAPYQSDQRQQLYAYEQYSSINTH